MKNLCIAALALFSVASFATDYHPERAAFNYQMFCQGCHAPGGMGSDVVPVFYNEIGHYLSVPEGREYLVRVPGSATSALNDARLAEVLNYILINFAGDSLEGDFKRYTEKEVSVLRKHPLNRVTEHRNKLLDDIHGLKQNKGAL